MDNTSLDGRNTDRNKELNDPCDNGFAAELLQLAENTCGDGKTAEEAAARAYAEANFSNETEPQKRFVLLARLVRAQAINSAERGENDSIAVEYHKIKAEIESCLPSDIDKDDSVDGRPVSELIGRLVGELPKTMRLAFVRRYWYFEPIETISRGLGMSGAKVEKLLEKARGELRLGLKRESCSIK